ncbi:MAG: ABC transporter permease [Phycisphaerales bacterium]
MKLVAFPFRIVRLFVQSLNLAVGQIWANKLRSTLTTLGIIIGVASVTAVIAALTGMKTFVLDEFESFGTNKIFMMPRWPDEGRLAHASWRVIRFMPEHFEGWEQYCPSVSGLTRIREIGGVIRYGERTVENARLTGIEPDWHEIENRLVIQGRTFNLTDKEEALQVCIISTQLRDDLRMDRDCTGQSILINDRRFTVIGLIEPKPQGGMFQDSSAEAELYIPFSTAWKMNEGWMMAMASSATPEVSEDAKAELRALLRRNRQLRPDDPDTFRLEVMQEYLEDFKNISQAITTVAAGIVAISLLVGGIGIMNIMLVSVSERTREIGLRKAVGARPSAILMQFLVEAVTLCLVGGLVGLAGGQAITMAMQNIEGANLDKAYIPALAVVLAFGFSSLVGVVFGMFPALKASRLDPIEALRHE